MNNATKWFLIGAAAGAAAVVFTKSQTFRKGATKLESAGRGRR